MLGSLVLALGAFFASYWVGWLFLNWNFLHKYDETDVTLQASGRRGSRSRRRVRPQRVRPRHE